MTKKLTPYQAGATAMRDSIIAMCRKSEAVARRMKEEGEADTYADIASSIARMDVPTGGDRGSE